MRAVIGIPRAMLYHRYCVLWKTFLKELGVPIMISNPTNKDILEAGTALAMDETCLSTKIFLGHVNSLIGKCDYILVPRICGFGRNRCMCTKFEALYDLTRNVFRDTKQHFLCYNVDVKNGLDEENAFREMGKLLGFDRKAVKKAYKKAKKEEEEDLKRKIKEQESKLQRPGIKILIAAHSYVIQDEYVGLPVIWMLEEMGVTVIKADITWRKEALKKSEKISPTLKWEMNRELLGSIEMYQEKVDGLILMSVFPCGPDSMANEMISRSYKNLPILNLVIDSQDGTAGMETRLESFIDIIHFKRGEAEWKG